MFVIMSSNLFLPRLTVATTFLCTLAFLSNVHAASARMDGQVLHNVTGLPIPNASVELNLEPTDGIPEYSVLSDPFGFFEVPDVSSGDYSFTVKKIGFVDHEESVSLAENDRRKAVVRLTPVDGDVTFDIFFQVWCLATHARLTGATVVAEFWEPDGNISGGPDNTSNVQVDDAGVAIFTGVRDGFYRFTVNKTGWEPITYNPPPGGGFITDGDRVRLTTSHFASVFMKPIKTPFTVAVNGYDPVKDMAAEPLKGIVINLTGIDPTDGNTLLPTRTGLTSESGDFRFGEMPPITYRVVVGRLGYVTKEVEVSPKPDGTFDPVIIELELEPTKVKAILSSPYQTVDAVNGATVRLQGIRGSNTEGIDRQLTTTADVGAYTSSTVFENLLPGRYWMHVQHGTTISGLPGFSGNISGPTSFAVKFFPRELHREVVVATTEEVPIELSPIPAVVRGRLFATDELANREEEPFNPGPNRVWRQVEHPGITFKEQEVINLLTNPVDEVVVDTDASGGYTALVFPGIYGVQIPGMSDYTGHNIEFGNISAGQSPLVRAWPYANPWPHFLYEFARHGAGVQLDSDQEYQMDLFTHRQYVNLCGFVTAEGSPFGNLILRMESSGAGVVGVFYNHFLDTGAQVQVEGPVNTVVDINPNGRYLVPDLVAGTYTLTLLHPDYSATPSTFTVAGWDAPGVIPAVGPGDSSYYFPGITHCYDGAFNRIFDFRATWNNPGVVQVERYNYNAGSEVYDSIGSKNVSYFRVEGLPDRLFAYSGNGVPKGLYTVWERHGDGWYSAAATGEVLFDGAREGGPPESDNTYPDRPPTQEKSYTLDLRAVSRSDPSMDISEVNRVFSIRFKSIGGCHSRTLWNHRLPAAQRMPLGSGRISVIAWKWWMRRRDSSERPCS